MHRSRSSGGAGLPFPVPLALSERTPAVPAVAKAAPVAHVRQHVAQHHAANDAASNRHARAHAALLLLLLLILRLLHHVHHLRLLSIARVVCARRVARPGRVLRGVLRLLLRRILLWVVPAGL